MWRIDRVPGMYDVRRHASRPFRDHPAVLYGLDRQGSASGRLLQGHRTHEGHHHPRSVCEIRNPGGDAVVREGRRHPDHISRLDDHIRYHRAPVGVLPTQTRRFEGDRHHHAGNAGSVEGQLLVLHFPHIRKYQRIIGIYFPRHALQPRIRGDGSVLRRYQVVVRWRADDSAARRCTLPIDGQQERLQAVLPHSATGRHPLVPRVRAGGTDGNAVVRADPRRAIRQRGRIPADTDGRRVLRIFQFHVRLSSALADREGDLGERGNHGQRDRESHGLRGSVADREHHAVDGVRGVLQHKHYDLHREIRRIHEI